MTTPLSVTSAACSALLVVVHWPAQCRTCGGELVPVPVGDDWTHVAATMCTDLATPVICTDCAMPAVFGGLRCADHSGLSADRRL